MPPIGGRHHYLLALAGFLLRSGRFDKETAHTVLEVAWKAAKADNRKALREIQGAVRDTAEKIRNGDPVIGGPTLDGIIAGLPKKLASLWGWKMGRDEAPWADPIPLPEGLPPVAKFDPALLPGGLRGWLEDIAERMQVPLDFPAAGAIVVLSSLVGRKLGIRPKRYDDWTVIPNLWGMVIGRPALLKSPALAESMKPLGRLVADAYEQHQSDLADHEVKTLAVEAEKKAFKKRLEKIAAEAVKTGDRAALTEAAQTEAPEDPEPPTPKRYKTEDATVEKIGELLIENPHGLLNHRDELSGWLRSLDKQGREGDRAFFLESWNGTGSFDVDRIGRGSMHIPALCLAILGGIQPGPLSSYVYQATRGEQGDDGLLQRFQVTVYPDPPKQWRNVDRYPNTEAKNKAYRVFKKLDSLKAAPGEEDEDVPSIRFNLQAQKVFDQWREELEFRLRSGEMIPALEAHLSKYRSLLPSLALLFELIDSDLEVPVAVGETAARRAAAWCEYLESHARRLYSSAENPEIAGARTLLERIQKGDLEHGSTVRDLYLKGWTRLSTPAEAKAALEALEAYGWLRVVSVKPGERGGRPAEHMDLHPVLRKPVLRESDDASSA